MERLLVIGGNGFVGEDCVFMSLATKTDLFIKALLSVDWQWAEAGK